MLIIYNKRLNYLQHMYTTKTSFLMGSYMVNNIAPVHQSIVCRKIYQPVWIPANFPTAKIRPSKAYSVVANIF